MFLSAGIVHGLRLEYYLTVPDGTEKTTPMTLNLNNLIKPISLIVAITPLVYFVASLAVRM